MSSPLDHAQQILRDNADPHNTRFGVLSDDETNAILRLMNAYTFLLLANAHVMVGVPQRTNVERN